MQLCWPLILPFPGANRDGQSDAAATTSVKGESFDNHGCHGAPKINETVAGDHWLLALLSACRRNGPAPLVGQGTSRVSALDRHSVPGRRRRIRRHSRLGFAAPAGRLRGAGSAYGGV